MRTDTEIQMFSHEFPHLFAAVINHKIINISNPPVYIKFEAVTVRLGLDLIKHEWS